MKLRLQLALATCVGWSLIQLPARGEDRPALTNIQDRLGYALGVNIGSYLKRSGFEVNETELMKGVNDALAGESKMTDMEAGQVVRAYQQQKMHDMVEKNT